MGNANGYPELPVERASVRGVELAFVRAGAGGFPLLLLHGWPETKRIWWRNIEPLAAAGFEVIVPDLRGFGDSGLAPDGFYDPATQARDLHALVHDVLGHERCAAAGGDVGGVVIQDLGLRFDGFVDAPVPVQHGAARAAGGLRAGRASRPTIPREYAMAADYFRPAGARGGRARRRARHARAPPPLHRPVLRVALLGGAGRLRPRRRRLHDRAVRRR